MPILGDLSEFPLPEVLLLIGVRTGRLRLLDVPEFGMMDIDFSNGEVQTMHIGKTILTEADAMVAKMSAVVQRQAGMFEFRLQPVESVSRKGPMMVNQLVMSLVCYVDELAAKQRTPESPEDRYVLEDPEPEIWIEPELNVFFLKARQFLTFPGIHLDDLARYLSVNVDTAYTNLTNLRLLGLIKLLGPGDAAEIKELEVQEEISRKSNEFLRASRAASEMNKISSRLPAVKRPAS